MVFKDEGMIRIGDEDADSVQHMDVSVIGDNHD